MYNPVFWQVGDGWVTRIALAQRAASPLPNYPPDPEMLRLIWLIDLGLGSPASRSYPRDTYPVSYTTKYTSVRRQTLKPQRKAGG